jgi:hypothetical protein
MFSADQSRRLDELITELVPLIHEPMTAVVKEFSDATMDQKFGEVWDVAELHAAASRVYAVTEQEVARELTNRLMERLLNPHAGA